MSRVVDRPPWVLESSGGLRAVIVDGGAPASLGTDRVELVQHAASAFAPALVQLWLRDRVSGRSWPMLGAGSGSAARLHDGALVVTGQVDGGLGWRVVLTLDPAPNRLGVARGGAQRRALEHVRWTSCTPTTSPSRHPGCCAPTSCT